jgi:hypothetical protein
MSVSQPSESPAAEEPSGHLVRLHISPLTPALLSAYLPPAVLSSATETSYHSLQTFPDRPFGFVTLPEMDADALKKKLNGRILKGNKVRIEDAKPKRKLEIEPDEQVADDANEAKKVKRTKKKKNKEVGVIEGYQLPDDRKVKRGWTEPAGPRAKDHWAAEKKEKKEKKDRKEKKSRKAEKSKYTNEPELLFRTKLPPTATPDKKSKKKVRDVVVHEFSKAKKHASFLKTATVDSSTRTTHEFVEGKGWVDGDGTVVEEVKSSRSKRNMEKGSTTCESKTPHPLETLFKKPALSIRPEPIETTFSFFDNEEVASSIDGLEDSSLLVPQTPFSQHVESRRARSAAPTPDTAAVLKRFSFSRGVVDMDDESDTDSNAKDLEAVDEEEEEEEAEGEGEEALGLAIMGAEPVEDGNPGHEGETPFAKWFWENRGENGRTWRRRRREALKEKRQRENRRLGRRIV